MPKIERQVKRDVEHTVQDRILKAVASMPDVRLMRNLVGTYETVKAGWIKAGLGPGTADLVGWITVPCAGTRTIARFLALEVKMVGGMGKQVEREAEQAAWLDFVRRMGGIGEFVTSAEEACAILEKARRWEL